MELSNWNRFASENVKIHLSYIPAYVIVIVIVQLGLPPTRHAPMPLCLTSLRTHNPPTGLNTIYYVLWKQYSSLQLGKPPVRKPRSPGPIYVSGLSNYVSKLNLWNVTDVTLADEDTNSILTGKVNRTIQCNVAMQV